MNRRSRAPAVCRAVGASVVFALLTTPSLLASPVPLLQNASGTAEVHTPDFPEFPGVTKSQPLTAPDAGELDVLDTANNHAHLSWIFSNTTTAADLFAQVNSEIGGYINGGSLTLNFSNDVPLAYHLRVHTGENMQGDGFTGAIDDKMLTMHLPYDAPDIVTLEDSGVLLPGQHQFLVQGESGLFKIGAHIDLAGEVKLELRPQAMPIPLPRGFWIGTILLGCAAIAKARRRLVV
jgi:hypothetical protein